MKRQFVETVFKEAWKIFGDFFYREYQPNKGEDERSISSILTADMNNESLVYSSLFFLQFIL